ncbi:TRAP transporter small permease subunit [Pistricoccus aurantiacus]|uniref:TRAP transporter small permease subunit n=1 Tax=Pistricoccus aurantiacus TaxID=1883414 RepID=UPI00363B991B
MPPPSPLPKAFARLDSFNEWLGRGLAWLLLAMMLVEFSIVVLRYAFDINSNLAQEAVMYSHATVFLLAAAYALRHDSHVRVDIFYRALSVKKKAWVDLLGTVFLLIPVMIFVVLSSLGYVGKSWGILEGSSEAGGIPGVFLLKTLIPVFGVLMLLQGSVEITRNALIIAGRIAPPATDEHLEERL